MSRASLPQFHHEIGARMARGDWQGAEVLAENCRAAWPDDDSGWLLGSIAALFANRRDRALELIEQRLARDPDNVQCRLQKAECLLALGERERAFDVAECAASATEIPEALDAIGTFFASADNHAAALRVYDKAVSASPHSAPVLLKRASIQQFLGRFEDAARDFQSSLALSPHDPEALKGLAELRRQSGGNSLSAVLAALAAAPPESKEAATLHFALAKTYEDMEDYSTSWQHLAAANTLERARLQYDPAQDRLHIERIIAGFSDPEAVANDSTGKSPIFIVGLPRTGTTLVERIVGQHSAVCSAGELGALSEAIAIVADRKAPHHAVGWLGYVDTLGALDGESIAAEYWARARSRVDDRPRFSDKAPANFYYCALIFRAFPKARILHLTRDPLATCYAIYKTRFNNGFPFAYDLAEIADFYIGYRKLMAHWHRILPGRILDVAYENLVRSQEVATRRILNYLELPFETACLDFHLNPNSTSTASSVQVRQPLYDSSVEQWRHYSAQLAPVRERLMAAGIGLENVA
jgi:tetratricopeptide (TPR) repeat protein